MKNKKLLLLIILFLVCIGLFGISYSMYTYARFGTTNSKQLVGDIYMHYTESNALTLENALPSDNYQEGKFFQFTIDGKNTNTKYDIWYDISLDHGDVPNGKTESNRILDKFLKFRLVEIIDNNEEEIFTNKSYSDLTNKRIYVNTILKNTTTEIIHTYRLYMWIGNNVVIGNIDEDYTDEEWVNLFASIKVNVTGDFTEKELEIDDLCFEREESNNNIIITGYDKSCGTVVPIPTTLDNKNVTEIKEGAFSSSLLTNVEIPNTVTKIEKNTFNDNNITAVTIPNTVTYLSCYAFDKDVIITKDNSLTCTNDETKLTKIMAYNSELDTGIKFYEVNGTTNGNGLYLREPTKNDTNPIYYYRGNINNNNVLYGNFCWKIVRTTETGGTKLIYNGAPTKVGDEYQCLNTTGDATQLSGTTAYSSSYNSPARVGYSYGTLYNYQIEYYTTSFRLNNKGFDSSATLYYFADDVSYVSNKYTLDSTAAKPETIDSSLVGKWTIQNSSSATGTSSYAYYVYAVSGTTAYMYRVTGGSTDTTPIDTLKFYIGTGFASNGTNYDLASPQEVYYKNWYSVKGNYVSNGTNKYYFCSDGASSCAEPLYITATADTSITYINSITKNYKFSKSFTYNGTNYILDDVDENSNPISKIINYDEWSSEYQTGLNNAHYTCLNASGTCTSIKYIYYTESTRAYYIMISDGKGVEEALNEMLSDNSNTNEHPSTIQTKINTWYESNIKDKFDTYLEDTEWCNDRSTTIYKGGWNPNGGSTTESDLTGYKLYFDVVLRYINSSIFKTQNYSIWKTNTPVLTCSNPNDRLSVTRGQIKYPISLLTYDEVSLAGGVFGIGNSNYYLYNNRYYWLLSPDDFYYSYANVGGVYSGGALNFFNVDSSNGARPAISLKPGTVILKGNGESTSPYVITEYEE